MQGKRDEQQRERAHWSGIKNEKLGTEIGFWGGRRLSERLKDRKGDRAGCIEKRGQHRGWGWGNSEMGLIEMHRVGYNYRVEAVRMG